MLLSITLLCLVDGLCYADWTQIRNFYGLQVEEKFHQPCAAWHSSGFYVFAAAAAGMVAVFHVGTSKVRVTSPNVLHLHQH